MTYGGVNPDVLQRVPMPSRRVLDLGCGNGDLGAALKARQTVEVIGVTFSESEAALARRSLDQVLVADLNQFAPQSLGRFDCIVCSHVLEHLSSPERLVGILADGLEPDGRLVVALPNVLHWRQRCAFLRGHFRYTDGGLMDRTHHHFFDWQTARELIRAGGFDLSEATATGTFPASRFLGPIGRMLDRVAVRTWPGLFGFQFLLVGVAPSSTRGAIAK